MWNKIGKAAKRVASVAVVAAGLTAATAWADTTAFNGQVNISGATLFRNFFTYPASTNDFIDVDGNGTKGWGTSGGQQLAPSFNYGSNWVVNYRGTGSGNGLVEMRDYHLAQAGGATNVANLAGNTLVHPTSNMSDGGIINSQWYVNANLSDGPAVNNSDPNKSSWDRTPVIQTSIDIAVMDVPTSWLVRNTSGTPSWQSSPGMPGYANNQAKTIPNANTATGASLYLKDLTVANQAGGTPGTLNLNTSTPTVNTIFDTPVAYVPIAITANQGTGVQNLKMSEMQYLFVTGRAANGKNLVVATRDPGSGTKVAAMNSIGVDPSFGRGDNLGAKITQSSSGQIGWSWDSGTSKWVAYQPTNQGGSAGIETSVANNRLGVGYDGMDGSGAVAQANLGRFEIVNVMKDIAGGTQYVRPSLSTVFQNGSVNSGWQIGGNETFATVGDPLATPINATYGAVAGHASNPQMANLAAAAYIRNIYESVQAYAGGAFNQNTNMPGEALANKYSPVAAMNAMPVAGGAAWPANTGLLSAVQSQVMATNSLGGANPVNPFGSIAGGNGLVPIRGNLNPGGGASAAPITSYSDTSVDGRYRYNIGAGNVWVPGGIFLNDRNKVAGDFSGHGACDVTDIPAMMSAINNPVAYMTADDAKYGNKGNAGSVGRDVVIPEIIGDFNGDGNFDAKDVRYFADGLAMSTTTGNLDRGAGFTSVDNSWAALHPGKFYFNDAAGGGLTTITPVAGTAKAYAAGDARFDVFGGVVNAGGNATGANGLIDKNDFLYVYENIGSWLGTGSVANPNLASSDAARIDLSCDMNGDLKVDSADLGLMLNAINSQFGDANLDGKVDVVDLGVLAKNYDTKGLVAGQNNWQNADFNGDGNVDVVDLGVLAKYYDWATPGSSSPAVPEPMTLILLAVGGVALAGRNKK